MLTGVALALAVLVLCAPLTVVVPEAVGTRAWVRQESVVLGAEPLDEGESWTWGVRLQPHDSLLVELPEETVFDRLSVQADNNDSYDVEYSIDDHGFQPLSRIEPAPEVGLRTRHVVLPEPVRARYLRFTGHGGDSTYAVSHVSVERSRLSWLGALLWIAVLTGVIMTVQRLPDRWVRRSVELSPLVVLVGAVVLVAVARLEPPVPFPAEASVVAIPVDTVHSLIDEAFRVRLVLLLSVLAFLTAFTPLAVIAWGSRSDREALDGVRPGRRDLAFLLPFSVAFVLLASHRLLHWYYVFIPDELAFFGYAHDIFTGEINPNPFSVNGVFEFNPVFSSYLQVPFMYVLANKVYAWKLSQVVYLLLGILAVYVLLLKLFGRSAASFASVTIAVNPIILAHAHMAYCNAQALLFGFAPLALCACWRDSRRLWRFLVLGLTTGLSLYTHYFARIAIPGVLLGLLLRRRPFRDRGWLQLALWMVGVAALAGPIIGCSDDFFSMGLGDSLLSEVFGWGDRWHTLNPDFVQMFLEQPEHYLSVLWHKIVVRSVYAAVFPFYFQGHSHYVYGQAFDLASAAMAGLGLLVLLSRWDRGRLWFWLLMSGALVMVFILNIEDYPKVTRLFMVVPIYSTLVALGLLHLWRRPWRGWKIVVPGLLVLSAVLQVREFYVTSYHQARYHKWYESVVIQACHSLGPERLYWVGDREFVPEVSDCAGVDIQFLHTRDLASAATLPVDNASVAIADESPSAQQLEDVLGGVGRIEKHSFSHMDGGAAISVYTVLPQSGS